MNIFRGEFRAFDFEPPNKVRKPLTATNRFNISAKSEEEDLAKGYNPKNTVKNTRWAVNVFRAWVSARNTLQEEKCPADLLEVSYPDDALARWLSLFTIETRRIDGTEYPPRTLHNILAALLRYMREINPFVPNFLDQKCVQFSRLHRTMDSMFHRLHSKGIGVAVKHASVISKEEEAMLWHSGILSLDNPEGLLNAVFYYNGIHFVLRGGEEHRNLCISQLSRYKDYWEYQENTSKNRPGGLKTMSIEGKTVRSHANPNAGDHCHVRILDKYFDKLPEEAFSKDVFYVRPLKNWTADSIWYMSVPVGKNTLSSMVPKMFKSAGLEEKTNHSLRSTASTALFEAGVPEKVIQNATGHRSLKALRIYERVSKEQEENVSRVLSAPQKSGQGPHSEVLPSCLSVASTSQQKATFTSLFGPLTNCQINIQYFSGPVQQATLFDATKKDEKFLEDIAKDIDL